MSNDYRSPHAEIVGREGMMFNEATMKNKDIEFQHFGVFSNTNTYSVTFNPFINRPPTQIIEHDEPVRFPDTREHITKPLHEPPVSITDGGFYRHIGQHDKPVPLLPKYLKKPEPPAMQGRAREYNKQDIRYGPTQHVITQNNIY